MPSALGTTSGALKRDFAYDWLVEIDRNAFGQHFDLLNKGRRHRPQPIRVALDILRKELEERVDGSVSALIIFATHRHRPRIEI